MARKYFSVKTEHLIQNKTFTSNSLVISKEKENKKQVVMVRVNLWPQVEKILYGIGNIPTKTRGEMKATRLYFKVSMNNNRLL
jgi:intein/homing endonuclease